MTSIKVIQILCPDKETVEELKKLILARQGQAVLQRYAAP